jgi:UDP-2,4-diacetamido-2,4,6-trideoxy-beta-L-altropyranose hydrolase/UDP-4-amino-4,6-dideoxy-N-acetyl-beta-L-altrosamine N-acetyltransferase
MRCLTLASEIKKHNANITFICNSSSKDLATVITANGINVHFLPEDVGPVKAGRIFSPQEADTDANTTLKIIKNADWLIIDHYSIDSKWEEILRLAVKNILVIDDLANRKHNCDFLLDQNFYINASARYKGLIPEKCKQLLGPEYALLREEFSLGKRSEFNDKVQKILISFGGSDPDNFTGKILEVLTDPTYKNITIDVVVGKTNKHNESIKELSTQNKNFNFHCQINYMARLMEESDLFIGAGGSTSWERLAMGLPSVVIAIADNQIEICESLVNQDLVKYYKGLFETENFKALLNMAIYDKQWRKKVFSQGKEIIDGKGAYRVVKAMLNAEKADNRTLRLLTPKDSQMILKWRNSDRVRLCMTNKEIIKPEQHEAWLNKVLVSKNDMYFIYEENGKPIGVVCFNDINKEKREARWGFYIGEENTQKGTGTRMCLKSLVYAYKELGLKVINADVFNNNLASIKLHFKLGFNVRPAEESDSNNKTYFKKILDETVS